MVYSRAKKRAFDNESIIKDKNTVATRPSAQPVTQNFQKTSQASTKEQPQVQAEQAISRVHQKVHAAVPFNIVDNMKKMNVTMSMWDSLAILGKTDLLRKALSNEEVPKKSADGSHKSGY